MADAGKRPERNQSKQNCQTVILVGLLNKTMLGKHVEEIFESFFFLVGIWSWLADKLHFILSCEAGFFL